MDFIDWIGLFSKVNLILVRGSIFPPECWWEAPFSYLNSEYWWEAPFSYLNIGERLPFLTWILVRGSLFLPEYWWEAPFSHLNIGERLHFLTWILVRDSIFFPEYWWETPFSYLNIGEGLYFLTWILVRGSIFCTPPVQFIGREMSKARFNSINDFVLYTVPVHVE